VGFVVDEMSLEEVYFRVLLFSCVNIILIMLYTQILLYLLLEGRGDEALESSNKLMLFRRKCLSLHT